MEIAVRAKLCIRGRDTVDRATHDILVAVIDAVVAAGLRKLSHIKSTRIIDSDDAGAVPLCCNAVHSDAQPRQGTQSMTARTFFGPKLRDRRALPALVLGASLSMMTGAMAQGQTETFALACSAKEIPSLTLIEEHGEAQDVSAERLSQAGMTLYRARSVCNQGRVSEALALYDSILTLGPVASLRR